MVHGMAAGMAFFARNFADLSRGRTVYAIDLPGFARSSRPRFGDDAEAEYVAALEAWRAAVGIDRMVLLGHSFGGYLCTAYALNFPNRWDLN